MSAFVVATLLLSIVGAIAFASFAVDEVVDWRLRQSMTTEELDEYRAYRGYLRTTMFGRDIGAWRALGRPTRERRP